MHTHIFQLHTFYAILCVYTRYHAHEAHNMRAPYPNAMQTHHGSAGGSSGFILVSEYICAFGLRATKRRSIDVSARSHIIYVRAHSTILMYTAVASQVSCILCTKKKWNLNQWILVLCSVPLLLLLWMFLFARCSLDILCDLFDDGAFAIYPDISTISHISVLRHSLTLFSAYALARLLARSRTYINAIEFLKPG